MKLTTGLLALLLDYVGQDHCGCRDAGSCIHCGASRALDEAETSIPAEFAEASSLSGPAACRPFEAPLVPSEPAGALPLPRVFIEKAHSGSPHHAPDNCDFVLVRVAPELAQALLAYRDALDCLAAGVRHRFSAAASVSHELKLFPPCRVDFVGSTGLSLPDGDPLHAAVEGVIESDTVVALPAAVDVSGYDLGEVTARTDTQHCRVSRDGVTFAAYAGDTIVSATTIGWDEIVAVWNDRSHVSGVSSHQEARWSPPPPPGAETSAHPTRNFFPRRVGARVLEASTSHTCTLVTLVTDSEDAKWRKTVACPAADFGLPPCAAVVTTYGYSTHEPSGEEDEDDGFYRDCKCLAAFGPRDIRYDDYYQRILDDLDAAPWMPVRSHAPPSDGAPGDGSA